MIETALERSLHILHIHAAQEKPGGEFQTLALLENLAKLGHRQTLLAAPGSPLGVDACARGIDVQPLSLPSIVQMSAEYDLVHAHDTRAHSMAAATARVPVIASRRVMPIPRGPGFRWKFRRTAHFIAVSHYMEQQLLNAGILPERISVVYDGVELAGPDDGAPREPVFLYLVLDESSGFPAMQAMARGVPVVASRVGALPEVIEDGFSGLLTSNDEQSVADTLARLPDYPELGAHGRARVTTRFTVDAMVNGTLAVYRQVLAPPPSSSS